MRAAHAARVRPALRVGLDRLEHQQLGAVQVADDRDAGRDARRRLVERRQVVQVQDVGVAASTDCSARHHAATWRSNSSSSSAAKTRSGAPGRSSKDGCIGGSPRIGSGAPARA